MNAYTCLIAEDASVEREGLRYLLEKRAYPVTILEAANGEQALQVIESTPVDVLITDIRMPFMDGISLSQRIRARKLNVKILICSAYGEFSYAQKAIDCGVGGYLLKPIQPTEFYTQFDQIMAELDRQSRQNMPSRLEIEKCWYDITHGCELDAGMRARMRAACMDSQR